MRERKRLALLRRQLRLRTIERYEALRVLAAARAEQSRLSGLAERSASLAARYRVLAEPENDPETGNETGPETGNENRPRLGAELTHLSRFTAQMNCVARSAHDMAKAASHSAESASQSLLQAQQRLDNVAQKMADQTRLVARQQAERSAPVSALRPKGNLANEHQPPLPEEASAYAPFLAQALQSHQSQHQQSDKERAAPSIGSTKETPQ
jgi:hypothetical protein